MGSIAGTGGSLFLRKGLVTAQVALSFLLLFGAGLFVRSLQNLKTTDTGVALDNLVTFQLSPALSGYDDDARRPVLSASCSTGCARRRASSRPRCAAVPILARRRMGQLDVGRRAPGQGRRGHAGVHERALARLLRDDEDSAARGARLPAAATRRTSRPTGRDRQPPLRRALLPRAQRRRQAHRVGRRPGHEADDRDHRRRRRLAVRRTARRRAPAGVRPELGQGQRRRSTCARRRASSSAYSARAQRGAAARSRRCRSTA